MCVTDGDLIVSYKYDHTGNRVKKSVVTAQGAEPVITTYCMAGDLLLSEQRGNDTIWYQYDSNANVVAMRLNGTRYFYVRNLQNDIVALTDRNGNVVVRYTYDAWGNEVSRTGTLADTVGVKNPFRYRGYYYDVEPGMYYLKNRFYDPEIRRFICADGYFFISCNVIEQNIYVYCRNDSINYRDKKGKYIGWVMAGLFIGAIFHGSYKTVNEIASEIGLNDTEKKLALRDPIAAYKVNESREITKDYLDKTYGSNNDKDGTQVNAYRHAMWNAVMTDKMGVNKAELFANAHEQYEGNPVEHMEMDLHNNALGRRIALEYAGYGYDVFSKEIQKAINNGEARVLKWDENVK